ncbi:MAG: transglycosylase domain-containing protein [Sandaracinaceae bacterium]|nr:transglycosylase domain-containing protein [Sandaracinaceae bacterium]
MRRTRLFGGKAPFLIAALTLAALLGVFWLIRVDEARFGIPPDSLSVVDRKGRLLRHERLPDVNWGRDPRQAERVSRRWVFLEKVHRNFIDAILAAEDARFMEHGGVDFLAMGRALFWDWLWGRTTGASTLTQQLIKVVYGRPYGVVSKVLEIPRALEVERLYGKRWVLEQCINRLPFGNGTVGVESASWLYFGHSAKHLSLAEAALLAALPKAPSRLNPYRHPALALARRNWILSRLRELGWRDASEIKSAIEEPLRLQPGPPRAFYAPRFVDLVLRMAREGQIPVEEGIVRTSLDLELQKEAEALLEGSFSPLERRGARNGGAIIVAHQSGEVLAYVGAIRSGPAFEGGSLDLLVARKQPGSTLKPLLYALFFEAGHSPATIVDDIRKAWPGPQGSRYLPSNYDRKERGPVSARFALGASLNLAALDVASRLGSDRVYRGLRAFGLRGLDPLRQGLGVVLGGIEVSPLELAEAYATIARGGTRVPLRFAPWNSPEPPEGVFVISPDSAWLVRDVLADPQARTYGFGTDLSEAIGHIDWQNPVALKTGTSSGWRDAWAVAFDDDFVVVVWAGDPYGRPMLRLSGFEGAAPFALRLLALAQTKRAKLDVLPSKPPPASIVRLPICRDTGLLPGPRCQRVVLEAFSQKAIPQKRCDGHDQDGALLLDERYRAWLERHPSSHFRIKPFAVTSLTPP